MAAIQVETNGQFADVTKAALFKMAADGVITPATRIRVNGVETVVGRAKGIVFGAAKVPEQSVSVPAPVPPPIATTPLVVNPTHNPVQPVAASFCTMCGNQVSPNAVACLSCGAAVSDMSKTARRFVSSPFTLAPQITTHLSTATNTNPTTGKAGKDKMTAGLLCLFLGGVGAHWFYLEK
jgi:hypothetical protein